MAVVQSSKSSLSLNDEGQHRRPGDAPARGSRRRMGVAGTVRRNVPASPAFARLPPRSPGALRSILGPTFGGRGCGGGGGDGSVSNHLARVLDPDDLPLYVVTVSDGDVDSGCVAGYLTQCSIEPERLLVCLSVLNHTYGVACRAQALAVHRLGASNTALAHRFAELSGDDVDKFAGLTVDRAECGAPVLKGTGPWVAGAILSRVPLGDHVGFLVAPEESGDGERAPLRSGEITLHPAHPPEEIGNPG